MTSSSQNLNNLNIHKVNTYKTWKDNYNQNNGIGESDLVIIPPDFILPRPFNSSTGAVSNGSNGQFLQTDGSGGVSWATVDALPSQSGNSGKFLTTNGSAASWATVDLSSKADLASPTFTGTPAAPTATAGTSTTQIATTKFVSDALSNIDALPTQTGNSGKYLTTNGTAASWDSQIFFVTSSMTNAQIDAALEDGKICFYDSTEGPAPLIGSFENPDSELVHVFLGTSGENKGYFTYYFCIDDSWSSSTFTAASIYSPSLCH